MLKQVFLGGACGRSTWRREAISALQAAGVTCHDPQLGVGEWTTACEEAEMDAKAAADALLFVINGETRGVASVAEAAYFLGAGRPLALVVTDIGPEDKIDGKVLSGAERDDLNRGRIFVRSMAAQHGVPVFTSVESATQHAIELVRAVRKQLTAETLQGILAEIQFKSGSFAAEEMDSGFLIQLCCEEEDARTGESRIFYGRKWHIDRSASASDVVRTAFKAAVTWQEHEAREGFRYRGAPVFGAHSDVEDLVRLSKRPGKPGKIAD